MTAQRAWQAARDDGGMVEKQRVDSRPPGLKRVLEIRPALATAETCRSVPRREGQRAPFRLLLFAQPSRRKCSTVSKQPTTRAGKTQPSLRGDWPSIENKSPRIISPVMIAPIHMATPTSSQSPYTALDVPNRLPVSQISWGAPHAGMPDVP